MDENNLFDPEKIQQLKKELGEEDSPEFRRPNDATPFDSLKRALGVVADDKPTQSSQAFYVNKSNSQRFVGTNKVYLCGQICSMMHSISDGYGEVFYEFTLKVLRKSGTYDFVPMIVSSMLLKQHKIEPGQIVAIRGTIRSYNKVGPEGQQKVCVSVFITSFEENFDPKVNPNVVELEGVICKKPINRVTPFLREITEILIAVNRPYEKTDYLPCIAWGRTASFMKNFNISQKISLIGRIQSRSYFKKTLEGYHVKAMTYEISIRRVKDYNDTDYFDGEEMPLQEKQDSSLEEIKNKKF